MHDYGDDVQEPSQADLQMLTTLVEQMPEAELDVKRAELALRKAQWRLKELREREIPELMERLGVTNLKTSSGMAVAIRKKWHGKIPKDPERNREAIQWLDDNGHGGLVKREFTLSFARDQQEWAEGFREQMKSFPVKASEEQTVHPSTLAKFLREQHDEGVAVPLGLFGGYQAKVAHVDGTVQHDVEMKHLAQELNQFKGEE